MSGDWPDQVEFDYELIERNLDAGEFFFITSSIVWNTLMYSARGDFHAAQGLVQIESDIGETYEHDFAKAQKFFLNTYLLTRWRKLQDTLNEAEAGIQYTGKTGFETYLIIIYSLKARVQFILRDAVGAAESLENAEKIKGAGGTIPLFLGDFTLSKFILHLSRLENALVRKVKTESSMKRSQALKAGIEALKTATKFAPIKTEALKLMGVYYWLIGKQRKAIKWWRKSIAEGQRLNDRLEFSRTYFEVGKRLLEPKSKYKELDGIKAEEYLEKARVMFEDMDLQWDLDELEKLRLHLDVSVI